MFDRHGDGEPLAGSQEHEHDRPLVDQRIVRRFEVNEGSAPGFQSRVGTWTAALAIVFSCGLFAADIWTDLVLALPRLWAAGAHLEFGLQLVSLLGGGALGAAAATKELGIWGKVDRIPRWLRWHFVAAMCGLFPVVPFSIVVATILAKTSENPKTFNACALARRWVECGGVVPLILSLLVQVSAAATYGVDLWTSIFVGFILLVKVASEHDTHYHVYLWLTYREGRDPGRDVAAGPMWEESTPLITGPLESLFLPPAYPMMALRAAEVTASLGCIAMFQAGTRDWLSVSGVGIGGVLLVGVQYAAHLVLFRMSSEWMSAGLQRAFSACIFVPKPTLDSEVPVMPHYAVMAVAQLAVLFADLSIGLPTKLPVVVVVVVRLSILVMWLLLAYIRQNLTHRGSVSESAAELAEKVRAGIVELQPLTADHAQLVQLEDFCLSFCRHFFGPSFINEGGTVKLALSGSNLEVKTVCIALVMAVPLLKSATKIEFDLEGTSIRDADIADLIEFLPSTTESFEVNLAGTQVGDVGIVQLAQSLPVDLRSLEAGFNSTLITDKGLAVLAQHLPQNLLSFEAILYNTQVGDRGVTALAKKLPPTLANFRAGLYKTLVGDEGVIAIAENLPAQLQIFRIELAGTKVTDLGASALAEHLPDKIVKFEANVSGTKVSAEVKALLKEASSFPAYRGRASKDAGAVTEVEEPPTYCCRLVPFFGP
mmetsp:Transcript_65468/g.184893  ORF Transcript_65468/g.184893 Transcript_65468/m.184893 type:complete len:711 (-) Transcript_65468:93-2225(-)